ncbi:hypothetical protein M758_7G133600 [Ceratodon purpureus]|nr:hypothetical protein M758_7G133600 [Ceratodon purpureus]
MLCAWEWFAWLGFSFCRERVRLWPAIPLLPFPRHSHSAHFHFSVSLAHVAAPTLRRATPSARQAGGFRQC